jgi:hypothetical protein
MKPYMMPAMLLALAACSEPSSTQVLSSRIPVTLSQSQPCNRPVSVEFLQDGARIHFPESHIFLIGRSDLSPCGSFALASVTQAMLDPRIMQVVIEPQSDANAPASVFALQRADTVQRTLSNVGFTQRQPPVLIQSAPTPSPGVLGIVLSVRGGSA